MNLFCTNHNTFNSFSCILLYKKFFVHLQGKFSSFSSLKQCSWLYCLNYFCLWYSICAFLLGYLYRHKEGLLSNTSQFFFKFWYIIRGRCIVHFPLTIFPFFVSPTSFRLYFISNFTNSIVYSFMDERFREECWTFYRRLKVGLFTCSHGAESLKSKEKHLDTSTWRKNTIHAIWHIFLCCKKCMSGVSFYYYQHMSIFRLTVYNIIFY